MTFERRREISILFGDSNRGMRMQYRTALRSEGFSQLHEFDTLENFSALCRQHQPDLVFMDAAMPDGATSQVVHALRHGSLGINPFVPVIIATWDASRPVVNRLIDCGADDVLIKPLSTQAISGRIRSLADNRKPFVVTADYIGPDRRRSGRAGSGDPRLLIVPNPLRAKLDGLPTTGDDFRNQIDGMRRQIDQLRLKAAAFRIAFVATQLDVILTAAAEGPGEAGEMLLNGLLLSAEDIRSRLTDCGGREEQLSLCNRLLDIVRPLAAEPEAWRQGGRAASATIQSVAAAMLRDFHPDRAPDDLTAEVAAAIERYRMRQAALATGRLPES